MAPSGEGRFCLLVPVGGYVLAQPFFLFTVFQAFLERGVDSWLYIVPDVVMFLSVFVVALFPALVVGRAAQDRRVLAHRRAGPRYRARRVVLLGIHRKQHQRRNHPPPFRDVPGRLGGHGGGARRLVGHEGSDRTDLSKTSAR